MTDMQVQLAGLEKYQPVKDMGSAAAGNNEEGLTEVLAVCGQRTPRVIEGSYHPTIRSHEGNGEPFAFQNMSLMLVVLLQHSLYLQKYQNISSTTLFIALYPSNAFLC